MLHGCTQNASEFAQSTQINELADRHGFVVAYPEQTLIHNGQRCWQWYKPAHQARDEGEPAIIAGITEEVVTEKEGWTIDPKRVYVAGISAGGAMSLILGATYPDVYAAVGVHSAPPYRSADTGFRALRAMMGVVNRPPRGGFEPVQSGMPPAIVFQGAADRVVNAINGERVAQQWLAFHEVGIAGPRDPKRVVWGRTKTKRSRDGRKFRVTIHYSARGRRMFELWRVDELGHAWSGGAEGATYSDPKGPQATTAMWRFFKSHSL